MREVIDESLANPRLYAWLVGLFAVMGTLLALAGIYGVIAYLVTLRTREFGIRMALGADTGRILRLVMSRGAWLTALGLAIGIAGAPRSHVCCEACCTESRPRIRRRSAQWRCCWRP